MCARACCNTVPLQKEINFVLIRDFDPRYLVKSAAFGQYITRYCFAKSTDSIPQAFARGRTTEAETCQRNTAERFTLQKQRSHERCDCH